MKIGDPKTLAFELMPGPTGFCGVSIWVAGQSFGEPELFEPWDKILNESRFFCSQAPLRISPEVFSLPSKVLLDRMYEALFGEHNSVERGEEAAVKYAPFVLSPNFCESLDGFSVVVVSNGRQQRVILRGDFQAQIHEVLVNDSTMEFLLKRLPEVI